MDSISPNLTVTIGRLRIPTPILTASGTFGYGREYEDFTDLSNIGAIVVKGISLQARSGNPPPRIVETPCGILNAIGLENVGLSHFIEQKMPYLRQMRCRVIVNILGDSNEEYCQLAEKLNDVEGVHGIELNISCPNVKKGGVAFGSNEKMAQQVTAAVRKKTSLPLIVKLSPNVTDIAAMASAVEEGGADAVSLINTIIGMAISIKTRKPILANIFGGLSGPAIKPIALRMVYQASDRVKIPVIGIGGISTYQDAIEFLMAGATAIQVGTANFFNPKAVEEIRDGIVQYMKEQTINDIQSIIGIAKQQ